MLSVEYLSDEQHSRKSSVKKGAHCRTPVFLLILQNTFLNSSHLFSKIVNLSHMACFHMFSLSERILFSWRINVSKAAVKSSFSNNDQSHWDSLLSSKCLFFFPRMDWLNIIDYSIPFLLTLLSVPSQTRVLRCAKLFCGFIYGLS